MTAPAAIRQFIAIFGGEQVAKGTLYEEPLHDPAPAVSFIIGQCDYIAHLLRFGHATAITCPFVSDTPDAYEWAAGKWRERQHERAVVEAYVRAGRLA